MIINKMGFEHVETGTNCQDFGVELNNTKVIADGCSAGLHSEVGAKLFCHLFSKNKNIDETYKELIKLFPTPKDIQNHLMFTVLILEEDTDNYFVDICGDGVIIKEKHDGTFEYDIIDYNNTPPYYAYNYIPEDYLSKYKEGVDFKSYTYSKQDYKSIGIASDGLEYILNSIFKEEFEKALSNRKEFAIKRLINREHRYFKDDITIAI